MSVSLNLYHICVPMFRQSLAAHSSVIKKAEEHCASNSLDASEFLQRRLAPDMFTLMQQVQRATFHAARAGAELAGVPVPEFKDDETSFGELVDRIDRARDFLGTLKPEQFEGSESKPLDIQTRTALLKFSGQDFLIHFAIPQVMFHLTTAYDIIRNAEIEVGKRDFLGDAANR